MKRIITAYIAASLFTLAAAPVGNQLLWQIAGVSVPDPLAIMLLWFAVVGVPSLAWSHQHLSRALGVRAVPRLEIIQQRDIPVGTFADSVSSIFGRKTERRLSIPDALEFRYDGLVISEAEMFHFLSTCWRRQQRGQPPLSRLYWVNPRRLDRTGYDARVALLRGCNLIVGERKQGTRNRLRWAPSEMLRQLKWRVG